MLVMRTPRIDIPCAHADADTSCRKKFLNPTPRRAATAPHKQASCSTPPPNLMHPSLPKDKLGPNHVPPLLLGIRSVAKIRGQTDLFSSSDPTRPPSVLVSLPWPWALVNSSRTFHPQNGQLHPTIFILFVFPWKRHAEDVKRQC